MQLKRLEIILSEKCNINPPCIMCGRNIHLRNDKHFYDNGFFDFALFDKFKDEIWHSTVMKKMRSDITNGILPNVCNKDCKFVRV